MLPDDAGGYSGMERIYSSFDDDLLSRMPEAKFTESVVWMIRVKTRVPIKTLCLISL